MAVTLINIGNIANDGTGDDLREAFIKINQNLEDLDIRSPAEITGTNLGLIGEGIFAQKIVSDLQFKKLLPGSNMALSSNDNSITFDAASANFIVSTDSGSLTLTSGGSYNVFGSAGIATSRSGDTISITNTGLVTLVDDLAPALGGDLTVNQNDILDANVVVANNFQGSLDGLVYGIDVRNLSSVLQEFDFGLLTVNVTSAIEFIVYSVDVEFGSFTDPAEITVDLGSIVV